MSEPVEPPRVVAEDPSARLGRRTTEVLRDGRLRLRPRAVGVRVVGGPHHTVVAQQIDLPAPRVAGLERRPELPPPVRARRLGAPQATLPAPVMPPFQASPVRCLN